MVDSPMSIVLLDSNRNRVGSTGRCRCRLLRGGECADWGTNWQNDPSHHRHSTFDQPEISFE
jgi:hypothetical protein